MKTYVVLISENGNIKYYIHDNLDDARKSASVELKKALQKSGSGYKLETNKKENNIYTWEVSGEVDTFIVLSDIKYLEKIVNLGYVK